MNSDEDFEMKHIYKGKENPIQYSRFYSHLLECDFSLNWYPFDTQKCYLDIKPSTDLEDFIHLDAKTFLYEGPTDLMEYSVKKMDMKVSGNKNHSKILVEIQIKRKIMSLVLTEFIPTLILICIGHMTNYFKEFFFEGLMSLNVTVMLLLTTNNYVFKVMTR